jgi:hypothetical protein
MASFACNTGIAVFGGMVSGAEDDCSQLLVTSAAVVVVTLHYVMSHASLKKEWAPE